MSLLCLVPLTACLDQLEPQSSVKGNFISHSLLSSMLNCNFLHCLVLKLKHHPAASFFKDDSLSAFILFTLMLFPGSPPRLRRPVFAEPPAPLLHQSQRGHQPPLLHFSFCKTSQRLFDKT